MKLNLLTHTKQMPWRALVAAAALFILTVTLWAISELPDPFKALALMVYILEQLS